MSSEFTEYNGRSDPALEGTMVSFSCPLQQELIGPNVSTCTNGIWAPDPRETKCKGIATVHQFVVTVLVIYIIIMLRL